MHLLHQLSFPAGSVQKEGRWSTAAVWNSHLGPEVPAVSSTWVTKFFSKGNVKAYQVIRWAQTWHKRWFTERDTCHRGFLCFPEVWFELKLLLWGLDSASHYCCPSYMWNNKASCVLHCSVSSNVNALILYLVTEYVKPFHYDNKAEEKHSHKSSRF